MRKRRLRLRLVVVGVLLVAGVFLYRNRLAWWVTGGTFGLGPDPLVVKMQWRLRESRKRYAALSAEHAVQARRLAVAAREAEGIARSLAVAVERAEGAERKWRDAEALAVEVVAANRALSARVRVAETRAQELEAGVKRLKDDVAAPRAAADQLRQKLADVQRDLDARDAELAATRAKCATQERALAAMAERVRDAAAALAKSATQAAETKQQLADARLRLAHAAARLKEKDAELQKHADQVVSSSCQVETLEKQVEEAQARAAEKEKQIQALRKELDALREKPPAPPGAARRVGMIRGIGTDVVDVARIASLHRRYGDRFLRKILTEEELAYCRSRAHPEQHIAGRFAAKEAVLKALGMGLFSGVALTDIAIRRDVSGKPRVAFARRPDVGIHVSISHTADTAIAFAVIEEVAQ